MKRTISDNTFCCVIVCGDDKLDGGGDLVGVSACNIEEDLNLIYPLCVAFC